MGLTLITTQITLQALLKTIMAYKKHVNALPLPSFDDSEPKIEVKEEEGVVTLILFVPGFRKEQLRVQVNNQGVLKVSGEKSDDYEGTKPHQFTKQITVPEHYDLNAIRAKFANGELRLIIPKRVMTPPRPVIEEKDEQEEPKLVSSGLPKSGDAPLLAKAETATSTDKKMDHLSGVNTKMSQAKKHVVGLGGDLMTRLKLNGSKNNVVIGLGIAMVAMVAIGAFVAYNYDSSSPSYMEV